MGIGMRPTREDEEKIYLRQGTFLVIWELLTRTMRNPDTRREVSPGNYEILFQLDEAERRALNWLAGAIQRGVPEVMFDELPELIAEEKRWIMARPK
jgi:hypothetical protein